MCSQNVSLPTWPQGSGFQQRLTWALVNYFTPLTVISLHFTVLLILPFKFDFSFYTFPFTLMLLFLQHLNSIFQNISFQSYSSSTLPLLHFLSYYFTFHLTLLCISYFTLLTLTFLPYSPYLLLTPYYLSQLNFSHTLFTLPLYQQHFLFYAF